MQFKKKEREKYKTSQLYIESPLPGFGYPTICNRIYIVYINNRIMFTLIRKQGHDFICYVKNINFMLFVLQHITAPQTGRDSITGCKVE